MIPGTRLVLGVVFVTLGLVYGVWYSYSVLLVALLREMGWNRSVAAGAFSLLLVVHGSSGPFLGWLAARYGPRQVIRGGGVLVALGLLLAAETRVPWHFYLTFGLLGGIGISAAGWVPSVLVVRQWASERIGTALGVTSSGIGFGMFALIPLVHALIEAWGFRATLRTLAAGVGGWVVLTTTFFLADRPPSAGAEPWPAASPPDPGRPTPAVPLASDRSEVARSSPPPARSGGVPARPARGLAVHAPRPAHPRPEGVRPHWTLETAVRSWRFWGMALVFFAGSFVTQMLLAHQVAFLIDQGVPDGQAAAIGGIVGLASIGGKTGWGIFSDRAGRELAYTLAFLCVLASLGTLAFTGSFPASPLPYAYAVLIGVGYAATAPLTPAIAMDLFGGPRFATIFGTAHVCNSLGGATGAWLAGALFDLTHSYSLALAVGALMAALAPALLWRVAPRRPNPPPPVAF